MEMNSILKMVSDENRLRIINLIKKDPLCVGEIQTLLGIQQSNTSRHLEKLKYTSVIKYRKEGNRIFYYLNDEVLEKYKFLDGLLYQDTTHGKVFKRDIVRLNKYKQSDYDCDDLKGFNFNYNKLGL